jgi:hypothetical protein
MPQSKTQGATPVCFSATASFTVGGALLPAGAYCVGAALRKRPSYLGLAVVPLVFGIQQISEGFVWLALDHKQDEAVRAGSLVFLFFALAFWPWWFSVAGALIEPNSRRRWLFVYAACFTTVWFWLLYYPLVTGDHALLRTTTVHHSIFYDYYDLPIYDYNVARPVLQLLYVASVGLPMALGSVSWGRFPALVLAATAAVSAVVYYYAFVSVWCFFAAVLSLSLCVLFYWLPSPVPDA